MVVWLGETPTILRKPPTGGLVLQSLGVLSAHGEAMSGLERPFWSWLVGEGFSLLLFFCFFFGNTSFGKVVGLWREFLFSHLNFCVLKFLLVKLDSEANSIVVRCWFRLWAKFAGIKSEKDNFRNETHLCFFLPNGIIWELEMKQIEQDIPPQWFLSSILHHPLVFSSPFRWTDWPRWWKTRWEMMTRIWTSYNNYMNWRPTCWRVSVDEANTPEVENMCEFWSINSHYFHIIGDKLINPNSRGLYTHCKDSLSDFPEKWWFRLPFWRPGLFSGATCHVKLPGSILSETNMQDGPCHQL